MNFERNYNEKKNKKESGIPYLVILLFVWVFVFAGSAASEGKPIQGTPPTIVSHTPQVDAGQVPVNGVISVVWDRPMQPDTTFVVTGPEGFLHGAFLYDSNTYTVSFLPEQNLTPDTRYGVMVVGQVDMEGQVQQKTYQWNFETVSPTSVSLVSFGSADEGLGQSWWWLTWPALMAFVSLLSLGGVFLVWSRRRLISA